MIIEATAWRSSVELTAIYVPGWHPLVWVQLQHLQYSVGAEDTEGEGELDGIPLGAGLTDGIAEIDGIADGTLLL